jgi:hypothetical protein
MNRGLCALVCAATLLANPASARVVLVGVDGASGSVIDPLLAAGELPSLARAGLIPGRDDLHIMGQFAFVLLRVHTGPFEDRDPILERLNELLEGARTAGGLRGPIPI